jgi:hypothetical protein
LLCGWHEVNHHAHLARRPCAAPPFATATWPSLQLLSDNTHIRKAFSGRRCRRGPDFFPSWDLHPLHRVGGSGWSEMQCVCTTVPNSSLPTHSVGRSFHVFPSPRLPLLRLLRLFKCQERPTQVTVSDSTPCRPRTRSPRIGG